MTLHPRPASPGTTTVVETDHPPVELFCTGSRPTGETQPCQSKGSTANAARLFQPATSPQRTPPPPPPTPPPAKPPENPEPPV